MDSQQGLPELGGHLKDKDLARSNYESSLESTQEEESGTSCGEEDDTLLDWGTGLTKDQWLGSWYHDESNAESGTTTGVDHSSANEDSSYDGEDDCMSKQGSDYQSHCRLSAESSHESQVELNQEEEYKRV